MLPRSAEQSMWTGAIHQSEEEKQIYVLILKVQRKEAEEILHITDSRTVGEAEYWTKHP